MSLTNSAARTFPAVYELTISLKETSPLVWRKFLVHEIIQLDELHYLIQMVMGWDDINSYEFKFGDQSYGPSDFAGDTGMRVDEGVVIKDAFGDSKECTYIYDHGDYWEHTIKITKVLEHDPRLTYPVCTGGENACPLEDCGGPEGYRQLISILAGKESEERNEKLQLVNGFFDPKTFDPNFINRFLLWRED